MVIFSLWTAGTLSVLIPVVHFGCWHIADDVLAALKVRYGVGCLAATYLDDRPVPAQPCR